MAHGGELRDASGLTITVWLHVTREWRVRRTIAKWLFALAALVLRCKIEVADDD